MLAVDNIAHPVIVGTDFLANLEEVAYNFEKCILRVGDKYIPE